jgi:hypothetical protein
MPWVVFRGMTDEDLGAVYLALGAAPPIRHWIDNAAPPTYCPVCGQMHGLGERNMALRHAAVPISADVLSAYEGRYVDEMEEDTVLIRVDDETLWVVATGEDPQEIIPLSERRFVVPGWGEQIEFENRDGSVRGYRSRFGLDTATYMRR